MSNKTPDNVAQHATIPDVLPLGEATLIGVSFAQGEGSALLRAGNGRIKRIVPGDKIGRMPVIAIAEDGVIVEQDGEARRMPLAAAA